MKNLRHMRFTARKLVMMALFVAMAVIFKRVLTIHLPVGIVSFAGFPIILAGLLFGPLAGGFVGAVSDLLGYPFCPAGPYSPFFTMTAALTGIVPAFILSRYFRENVALLSLMLAIFAGQCLTKVFIVPLVLQVHFGVPFLWKSITNLMVELIHVPIYAMLAETILIAYGRIYQSEPLHCGIPLNKAR